MPKIFRTISLWLVLTLGSLVLGQTADLAIENVQVTGDMFHWEVHLTPTNDWSTTGNSGLGDCSWYFTFNSDALVNPVITYAGAPVDSLENYVNTVGLTGTGNAIRVYIDTDFTLDLAQGLFGVQLNQGTDYHLFTVEMAIVNNQQSANLAWDQINTGLFTAFDYPIIESYSGDSNIVLSDVTMPTVAQVSALTAEGSYRAGETIDILVQFSEPVFITGDPTLEIDAGDTARQAFYAAGSESDSIRFIYTIQAEDNSPDLDYTGSDALRLNSGAIMDGAGNNAVVTLAMPGLGYSLAGTSQIVIDTEAPVLDSGAMATDNAYLDLSFSEGLYTGQESGGGVDRNDFSFSFAQNSGNATAAILDSVRSVVGNTLLGGEQSVRLWLSVTGSPSGDEFISISPFNGNALFDLAGNPLSASGTVTTFLIAQFIPPVMTLSSDSLIYMENGGFAAVDANLTLTDENDTQLDSAWVRFSAGYHAAEDTLVYSGISDIIAHYKDTYGVLTLTGNALVEDYQSALRTVMYKNKSNNPASAIRAVEFVANDGGGNSVAVTKTIVVVPVNDAPVLTLADTMIHYTENTEPVTVFSALHIVDPDDSYLDSAWIAITAGYLSYEDTLMVDNPGNGSIIFHDSTGIMTVAGPLTVGEYEDILGSVMYGNASENPDTTLRIIAYGVYDGEAYSDSVTRRLTVISINDAPVLSQIGDQTTNEDTAKVITLSAEDVDSDHLSYTVFSTEANVAVVLDGTTLTLTSAANWNGLATIHVAVTDDGENALSDSAGFNFIVNPVNDLPNALAVTGNGPYGGIITIPLTATDIDDSDPSEFTFTVVTPPQHISGDVSIGEVSYNAGTFTATATYRHDGSGGFTDMFTYQANDGDAASDIAIASRSVNPTDYTYSATMTAQLQFDFTPQDDGNMIAAFSHNECVGIAEPINQLGQWLYFLTFYSNVVDDTIQFYAWRSQDDLLYPIEETVLFQPSMSYGTPIDPFILNIIANYDFPPTVTDIPDQTIEIGNTFAAFDLDDFMTLLDDDSVYWSAAGNSNLAVSINVDHIVSVSPVLPEWTGSEVITFTATDRTPEGLYAEDEVVFSILPTDHPPELSGIPSQGVGFYQPFAPVVLNNYLNESDGDSVAWDYRIEPPAETDLYPDWNVTPQDYMMTMTVTAVVESQGRLADSGAHTLAAFSSGECRGTATATNFAEAWLYFLTVYSNTPDEEISFRFYDDEYHQDLPVSEILQFSSGASIGTPQFPYRLDAGHFLVEINATGQATITPVESLWAGNEAIRFIVTDVGTLHDYSDTSTAMFTVYQDYAPVVSGIEDQTTEQTINFETFDLDDYLTELDGQPVAWSYGGNVDLNVSIDIDNMVTISAPNSEWTGSETITFTVTDQTSHGFFTSDQATFAVLPLDHPPVLSGISDQIIGFLGNFSPIPLNDYLMESDGDSIVWSYTFQPPSETDTIPVWSIESGNYELTMAVTARVISRGADATGSEHLLAAFAGDEIRGMAYAINALEEWLYFLTVYANTNGEQITFKFFDANSSQILPVSENLMFSSNQVYGTPQDPLQLQAGHLLISVTDNTARAEIVDSLWAGTETIQLNATDYGTLHNYTDSASVNFTILPDHTPLVTDIPDQTIEQGSDFQTIDLDSYLTEYDGDSVLWNYSGNVELVISIDENNTMIVYPPNADWLGSESIIITVTDDNPNAFFSSDTVLFTVLPLDHPPQLAEIPNQTVGTGAPFEPINLDTFLTELDGDDITWSYAFAPSGAWEEPPEWSVQMQDYQFSMNLTTRITIRGTMSDTTANVLGAFTNDVCRGIAEPQFVLGQWIYFMTIYGNTNGDSLEFRVYDSEFGDVVFASEKIEFSGNNVIGTPDNPFQLEAGNINITIDSSNVALVSTLNLSWSGIEAVHFIAEDIGTLNRYSDSSLVMFTVLPALSPVVADIPDQIINEGETFISFDLDDYLVQPDSDMITWSYSGEQELMVTINSGNVVTVLSPDQDWFGTETIRFIATNSSYPLLSGWDEVNFVIHGVNDPPVISAALPDVAIAEDSFGAVIIPRLEDYFNDIDDVELSFMAHALDDGLDSVSLRSLPPDPAPTPVGNLIRKPGTKPMAPPAAPEKSRNELRRNKKYRDTFITTPFHTVIPSLHGRNKSAGRTDSTALVVYPSLNYTGNIRIRVQATDSTGLSALDTLLLTIQNRNDAPIANAGDDQTVISGMEVTLDGTGSYDIEGNELTYAWSSDADIDLTVNGSRASFTAPDEEGTYLFMLSVSDGALNSALDTATVVVQPVTTLDTLSNYTDNPPEEGDSIGIAYSFPVFLEVDTAALYFTEGGGLFEGIPMESSDGGSTGRTGGVFSAVIPSDVVTNKGVAYYIWARDVFANILVTDTVSIPVRISGGTVTSSMDGSLYPDGIQQKVWRMVSAPTELEDASVSSVFNIALGTGGEYRWRLYKWNGLRWEEALILTPGNGYWFNQWVVDTSSFGLGKGLSPDLTGTSVRLLPGWNLISSPYLFPVRVAIDSSRFTGLYSYGDYDGEGWNPELTNMMKPWGAYAIFNRLAEDQIFIVDPLNQPNNSLAKVAGNAEGWMLRLDVSGDGYADLGTTVGRHPAALETCDAYDQPKPFSPGDYISLSIMEPEWEKGLRNLLREFRSTDEINGIWELELTVKGNHGILTVATEFFGSIPSKCEIVLVDRTNGAVHDVMNNGSFTIEQYSEAYTRRYSLVAGEPGYVGQAIAEIQSVIPREFSLSQNYPNPFNPTTVIRYAVTAPGNVRIVIYDLKGREVKTLVNRFHDIGYNHIEWHGTDNRGVPVATGVYIYRMTAPGIVKTRKMALIK